MPIPTRSASLREPRKPQQTTSNIARPTTNTTIQPAGLNKPPARSTHDKVRPPSNPPPADGPSVKDNAISNRGRTLLPQRSNPIRDDGNGLGQARLPPPETRVPQRGEPSPTRHQPTSSEGDRQGSSSKAGTGSSAPTRRQSLMRPGALKISGTKSHASAPSKATAPTFVPPSPRKQPPVRSPVQSTAQRPPSPRKTDMPPPPRPARSASLRQPVGAASGSSAAVRGHVRHRSQMVPTSTRQIQPDSALGPQKHRSQFSTYQQNYSPKKPTKPPTPTPGEAIGGTGDLLIPTSWPDIAALQTELLQLSLFHSNSLQRHTEWKLQSESQLRKKYDAVATQYQSMLGDENIRQRQLNAQALNGWLQNCRDHQGLHGFPEQIQLLSQILQDISDLVSSGMNGKYEQAVETFELWFQQVEDIRHQRKSLHDVDGTAFVDPLDRVWKEEVQALHAKLELCTRQLQSLDILGFGEVERLEQSALARVAQSLGQSIQIMIQEIRAMRSLEAELVRSEREMVSNLAKQLTSLPQKTNAVRVGIWRC
ncbi:uncharacterized protein N7459_007816 [Penicillium hispanicum]|uniref:uncharacterized protein n=1 Tax=Penicillium hispanicum TaxID=1080232 RepID=UPI0025403A9D|nr:uncharacterized protein N7459_007816 [Penicillium hispanicum]KAJ5573389.1 hypothetical protein N7459_007816 [Penicillium hispanicum]